MAALEHFGWKHSPNHLEVKASKIYKTIWVVFFFSSLIILKKILVHLTFGIVGKKNVTFMCFQQHP